MTDNTLPITEAQKALFNSFCRSYVDLGLLAVTFRTNDNKELPVVAVIKVVDDDAEGRKLYPIGVLLDASALVCLGMEKTPWEGETGLDAFLDDPDLTLVKGYYGGEVTPILASTAGGEYTPLLAMISDGIFARLAPPQ